MDTEKPTWEEAFKKRGYRFTIPRKIILDVLNKTENHPSAEEIFFEAHKLYPDIGLTTVYRTLEVLVEMGLVTQFYFGEKRSRYELVYKSYQKGHHHHLICIHCKKIVDYDDFTDEEIGLIKSVENGLTDRYGFNITDHRIHFYGLCNECNIEK